MRARTAAPRRALDRSPARLSRTPHEVNAGIKKKPNNVDKAPVDSNDLKGGVVDRSDFPLAYPPQQHVENEANSDYEMNCVEPRSYPVEHPEQLPCPPLSRLGFKIDDRDDLALKIQMILITFDEKERDAQRSGSDQPPDHLPSLALCGRIDSEHHRQAAGQQEYEVDGAAPQHRVLGGFSELMRIGHPIHKIDEDQSAKEQGLVYEEDPHPELG